ncbi:MAG: site-specific tyrosine recombinase XerC [Candidatus Brocadiales bacterium]|nr:site-specific tyrosine recombinase XerC [Candidatus Brocadiales bacterium]
MIRRKPKYSYKSKQPDISHSGFYPYLQKHLEWMKVKGFSEETNSRRKSNLSKFIHWCDQQELKQPQEITKPIVETYQRYLFYYRKPDGKPLTFSSQNVLISSVKAFFKWMTQENHLLYNPASEVIAPKRPKHLPRNILSLDEVNHILKQPNTKSAQGIRERSMLELLYSTGIRRLELCHLQVYDVDHKRLALFVYEGKGKKDRILPIGKRAYEWLKRYLDEVRPNLLTLKAKDSLYITDYGDPYQCNTLNTMVRKLLDRAGIEKKGCCHLFRHAMATHMLENGADIRFIQAMLGHSDLNSTQIYTHVSIEKLKAIHQATHPSNQD